MNKRNYGIDVMKALAMMMVVAHHIIMTLPNDVLSGSFVGDLFLSAFHGFCYCAVDCFVMATGFVMCEKEWRVGRIFRLWGQVVGYSVALVLIAWAFCPTVKLGLRDWLYAFMPITFDRYWFVTQYVALFFTMPFLNKMIMVLTFREHLRLLITGLCLLSLSTIWSGRELFITKWGYSYIWFLYLYLVGTFVPRVHAVGRLPSKSVGAGLIVLGSVLAVGADVLAQFLTKNLGGGARFGELLWSYASPTILAEAIGMMIVFSQLEITGKSVQKVVGALSASTFIVYVVHSNAVFQQMVGWKSAFAFLLSYGAFGIIAGSAIGAVVIYGLIVLVDLSQRQLTHLVRRRP